MDSSLDAVNPQGYDDPQTSQAAGEAPRAAAEQQSLDDPKSIELSSEFVGRWTTLVSTTNWEKGRIIHEWREALMGSESPASSYSDEAWSRRVGGVTPQHVGRLRRVYDRFAAVAETYPGLYWSHFLAALDWDDAEMWLEGAVQSDWSVSQMRKTRWEANGEDPALRPAESDIVGEHDDEDYAPLAEVGEDTGKGDGPRSVAEGPRYDDPDFGDESDDGPAAERAEDEDLPWEGDAATPVNEASFAKLPSLPVDIAEAVEQFKLAIIRHRAASWSEVAQDDVVQALDALKTFVRL